MLRERALSTAIFVPPLIVLLVLGNPWLSLLIGLIVALGALEAFRLLRDAGYGVLPILGLVAAVAVVVDAAAPAQLVGTGLLLTALAVMLIAVGSFAKPDPRDGLSTWVATTFGALYVGLLAFVIRLVGLTGGIGSGKPLQSKSVFLVGRDKTGHWLRNRYSDLTDKASYYGIPDPELAVVFPSNVIGLAARGSELFRAAVTQVLAEALRIHAEDEEACAAMGRHALPLLGARRAYLTHCNSGRLATAGIGTAFGVFVTAQAAGLEPSVFVGEVRPLLQGARLTAFELAERSIRGTLLPDSAAGSLLRAGRVDAVFVGADRIARNGDTANKVGTYPIAELARANGVPFYVVAPTSTIDATLPDGSLIPIEERSPAEVAEFRGVRVAPAGFPVWNPAFDLTPGHLVSAFVTELGVHFPPYHFGGPARSA